MTSSLSSVQCKPRWSTPRRYDRPTWGPYWGRVAKQLGRTYLPWQQHAADLAGEVLPNGLLAYKQVIITVPRQSGKTTLLLSVVVGRAEAGDPFGGRQKMVYAAQTREDAREKWLTEYVEDLRNARVMRGRFAVRVAAGSERVTFASSRSTFGVIATKETSGHGNVMDWGALDEAFAQKTDAVEASWRPAMITRPMSQLWIPSTAGDATSVYFKAKVDAGRIAAEVDAGSGIAYVEYSAPDDADPHDPAVWRACMPAGGLTQPWEAIQSEHDQLMTEGKLSTWRRAFLNHWVDKVTPAVFDVEKWAATRNTEAERVTRPVFAVDVSADRTHACIAMGAAQADGTPMVRVVDYRPGTGWVVDRLLELREQYRPARIVLDGAGPVRSLIGEIEAEHIRHVVTTAGDMVAACGALYDAVMSGSVTTMAEPVLELAVMNAERRDLNDAWAWTRKRSHEATRTDISPLVAATLAYWGQIKFGDDPTQTGGAFG